ncbi:DsbA family oxidoreductase [Pseudaquabacterium rugosum]|uniref:DsbA family oxidoreductase n=1 Tax=Pseudaquabacterium rugosum TaxID=2984194 RepID=A0ABU9B8D5_9BURK
MTSAASPATPALHIDFVSDVACPWCAIGLHGLLIALERLGDSLGPITLQFQPFRLNPDMGPEGEDIVAYLSAKYGLSAQQVMDNQAAIRERAATVGFDFAMDKRSRSWNTWEAHRLLHEAGLQGPAQAVALKRALFAAYFTEGENPTAPDVLRRCAQVAGLDMTGVEAVLADPRHHAEAVREAEDFWRQAGIRSVPGIVIDRQHLISGGQPPEVFEQALRRIAAGRTV